ncbi:MAG: endonuclease, partial [Actinomycetota bacterium]|nr:endonuclease [Actinomycetota bacterium]
MRIVVARCSVEYQGRLTTELPEAVRLLMVKGDGTLLIHNDRGGKPLNWMSPPSRLVELDIEDADSTGNDATTDVPEGTK